MTDTKRKVIFSAMQITGRLHLGNLEGALANWVELQDEYELYAGIVDLHSLTTAFEDTSDLMHLCREAAIDYLAAGLDPEKMTLVVQSQVPAHCELHVLLSMLTPLGWLERVPTYKEKKEQLHIAQPSYGLFGYPVLMAADILVYRANAVPVGRDQVPHLEMTREIARRFNYLYGEVFPEPEALLTEFAVLPGLDGRKMSKSYGNCIYLSDTEEEVRNKVKTHVHRPHQTPQVRPRPPGRVPGPGLPRRLFQGDAPEAAESLQGRNPGLRRPQTASGPDAGGSPCTALGTPRGTHRRPQDPRRHHRRRRREGPGKDAGDDGSGVEGDEAAVGEETSPQAARTRDGGPALLLRCTGREPRGPVTRA